MAKFDHAKDRNYGRAPSEYGARVEKLTDSIIAAIETAGASYPEAKHALARALGIIIGSNSEGESERKAALSTAMQAIAGCTESADLIAKYGGGKLIRSRARRN